MTKLLLLASAAGLATTALAAPATYTIDSAHTYPSFEVPHMGVSWWRGKFARTTGSVVLDKEARSGSVDIRVDTASIDFGHDKMDEHARSVDFFNVAEFPEARYQGSLVFTGDVPTSVDGQLTLLGLPSR